MTAIADWTDFELHCIFMGYEAALRPACAKACERLTGKPWLTPEVMMMTYEAEITPEDCFRALDSYSLLSRFVFESFDEPVMNRPLVMKEWLVRYILNGNAPLPIGEMFVRTEIRPADDPREIRHAKRMACPFTPDDIVLPEEIRKQLKQACEQVLFHDEVYDGFGMDRIVPYGRGVSVLLSGPPGTGKTMAAQIMAKQIGKPLYRVSLPAVVSKYIGETEKNLDEIFDQAGRMNIVLLFDEADVLFGKRTEIRDSNDKYSNMEAAFLLQKIEDYEGVVILATNLRQNFDEAFSRRMKFVIDFPFPDAAGRTEIWNRSIPEKLMNDSIDTAYLGRQFELAGSHIKNIVLHAAFLTAAEGGKTLTMPCITESVRHEYAKLGKVMTEAELGKYYDRNS